jgi:hypothetical protein
VISGTKLVPLNPTFIVSYPVFESVAVLVVGVFIVVSVESLVDVDDEHQAKMLDNVTTRRSDMVFFIF